MKWLDKLLFAGEEGHWSDYVWIFGVLAIGIIVPLFTYLQIK